LEIKTDQRKVKAGCQQASGCISQFPGMSDSSCCW